MLQAIIKGRYLLPDSRTKCPADASTYHIVPKLLARLGIASSSN